MRKYFLLALLSVVILTVVSAYQYIYFNDGKLHITFCDVGQGDAIFIRSPGGRLLLVDGGPDNTVLECLSSKMGYWERVIDLVILTHPHQDHFFGINFVLDRFSVLSFASLSIINTTSSYNDLLLNMSKEDIKTVNLLSSDRFNLSDDLEIKVLEPDKEFLARSSPNGKIGESNEFASTILQVTYKDFDLLLTGDAQTASLNDALESLDGELEVLQIPHHGSATGFTPDMLEKISPKLAVISVGKNNRYGHPNIGIIKSLTGVKINILRTDQKGTFELVTDGDKFWIQ